MEDGRLAGAFALGVVVFQRQQQRQIRVAPESGRVGPVGDRAELGHKRVVGVIQLTTGHFHVPLVGGLQLGSQTTAHRVPDADEPANSLRADV